jgi:hypothetical protein
MRANAVKTEDLFRNEEVATIGSNSKSASVPAFAEPSQEFHVISRHPKTTDQRQDPSNIHAIRPKAKHEPLLNAAKSPINSACPNAGSEITRRAGHRGFAL